MCGRLPARMTGLELGRRCVIQCLKMGRVVEASHERAFCRWRHTIVAAAMEKGCRVGRRELVRCFIQDLSVTSGRRRTVRFDRAHDDPTYPD